MARLADEQAAFLLDFCKLIVYATELGFTVTPGELLRTIEQQRIYVETGRSKTMDSPHIRKLAGDLNFIKDGVLIWDAKLLEPIGRYWESLNPKNRWGGNFDRDWTRPDKFVDRPHFERRI